MNTAPGMKKEVFAPSRRALTSNPLQQEIVIFVRIVSPRGNALFVSIPKGFDGFDATRLGIIQPHRRRFMGLHQRSGRRNAWTVGMAKLSDDLTLQVGKSTTQSRELLSYFRTIFLITVVPILLLGIIGGGLLTFRAIRPIRRLIQTVRNILRTGKTSTRVPVSGGSGEMEELVSLFNQMLDRNDSLIRAMHNSLDNVAHDLRTPMTRLRGVAELALQDSGRRRVLPGGPCRLHGRIGERADDVECLDGCGRG